MIPENKGLLVQAHLLEKIGTTSEPERNFKERASSSSTFGKKDLAVA